MIELGPDKDEKVEIEMPLSALQYEQVTSDNLIKPTHSVILSKAVQHHVILLGSLPLTDQMNFHFSYLIFVKSKPLDKRISEITFFG